MLKMGKESEGGRRDAKGQNGEASNSVWLTLLLIAVYLSLNISLNMINKYTLSHFNFKFPILLSMAHQAFSLVALAPLMATKAYREQHTPTISKQWLGLIGIAGFFAFNLGANNMSLLSISLSLNQVIRACIPVATALGSVFFESKTPTRQELISLVVLVSGVGISVWEGNSKATVNGITLCILGTLSNGFMMACIGRLLSEKLDVWRLTFYTAPMTVIMLLPFYWALESEGYSKYKSEHSAPVYLALVGLGCCNALAYNVVHSQVIKVTSSVTTTVLGEMKIVLLLVLSSLWLGESDIWSAKMLLGVVTALLGFVMYSHAKLNTGANATYLPVIKGVPELPSSLSDSRKDLTYKGMNLPHR